MSSARNDRRYLIQNCGICFLAGTVPKSKQVILGLHYPDFVALFFDQDGNLIDVQTKEVPDPTKNEEFWGPYLTFPAQHQKNARRALRAWLKDMRFKPGTVRVKKFYLPDRPIGIQDLPQHLEEFLNKPEIIEDREERAQWYGDINDWRKEGMFVFSFGKDYWMDKNGGIEST
jgi:hypothetical protein